MASLVLFQIENRVLREKLMGFLEGDKYRAEESPLPEPTATPTAVAQSIMERAPQVVVMDYVSEDAFSVKALQEVTDHNSEVGFIFVDSRGETDRENIMMAFNEGARAFLPAEVTATSFLNTVARVQEGPARFRPATGQEEMALAEELQKVGDQLSKAKVNLKNAQKLISYLLSTPVNLQPRKILVLSDSGYQRELLRKILEDANFVVLTAGTIEDAVSQTLSEKPRVVISDYRLEEGKTGVDFCRELKFNHKYGPCFFVVCTAGEDMLSKIMGPGNGVDDCLLKPSTDSSISDFIARVSLGLIL
ncbi:MAG: response regulator [Deltaproteobacteria bacterium]|jgi:DNA-binding response OmpR family regulator|nr:response regulator [Deltaproteobacteria bacterium]